MPMTQIIIHVNFGSQEAFFAHPLVIKLRVVDYVDHRVFKARCCADFCSVYSSSNIESSLHFSYQSPFNDFKHMSFKNKYISEL